MYLLIEIVPMLANELGGPVAVVKLTATVSFISVICFEYGY